MYDVIRLKALKYETGEICNPVPNIYHIVSPVMSACARYQKYNNNIILGS